MAVACNIEVIAENIAVKLLIKRKSAVFAGGFEQCFAAVVNRIVNSGLVKHCLKNKRLNAVAFLALIGVGKLHGVKLYIVYLVED